MESSFAQHLGTNYVPTVEETIQIEDLVKKSSKEVQKLDQEIQILEEKRSKIHDFVQQHQALISPARRLTHDVVAQIFVACLPEDRNPCMTAREAPMLLTRICSSWRRLALSTPQLWSAIHIVLPSVQHPDQPPDTRILAVQQRLVSDLLKHRGTAAKEWLGRSGVCPLSISIHEVNSLRQDHTEDSETVSLIRDAILPYRQRWFSLDLHIRDSTRIFGHLIHSDLKAEHLTMLKKFHITALQVGWPGALIPESVQRLWKDVIAILPLHLNCATFHGIPFYALVSYSAKQKLHDWKSLTELNLCPSPYQSEATDFDVFNSVFAIISHCHSLVTVSLDLSKCCGLIVASHVVARSKNDIVLNILERLVISLPSSNVAISWMKLLHLPILKELDLEVIPSGGLTSDIGEEILNSLLRTSEFFYSLKLRSPSWMSTHMDFIRLLRIMPGLKHLSVTQPRDSDSGFAWATWAGPSWDTTRILNDELLRALTSTGKEYSDIICPRLEELDIHHSHATGFTEAMLKEFVMSRKNDLHVASLRRLSIPINDYKMKEHSGEDNTSVLLGKDSVILYWKPNVHEESRIRSPYVGTEKNRDVRLPDVYDVHRGL